VADLNSLAIFAKVVEAKGFSEAARRLKIPLSTEHAQRSAELSEAVDNLVSNQLSTVAGVLRLSAPPSIFRHLARTAARRVPGVLPERPGTGFGHRSVCRPYR
jgi:DNA-binding transcriptional LysR family regulator